MLFTRNPINLRTIIYGWRSSGKTGPTMSSNEKMQFSIFTYLETKTMPKSVYCQIGSEIGFQLLLLMTKYRKFSFLSPYTCVYGFFFVSLHANFVY